MSETTTERIRAMLGEEEAQAGDLVLGGCEFFGIMNRTNFGPHWDTASDEDLQRLADWADLVDRYEAGQIERPRDVDSVAVIAAEMEMNGRTPGELAEFWPKPGDRSPRQEAPPHPANDPSDQSGMEYPSQIAYCDSTRRLEQHPFPWTRISAANISATEVTPGRRSVLWRKVARRHR